MTRKEKRKRGGKEKGKIVLNPAMSLLPKTGRGDRGGNI